MQYKITFANANNFVYDNTKITVLGGLAYLFGVSPNFSTTNPLIKMFLPFSVSSLTSLSATTIVSGGDEIRFVLEVDGIKKYWNGSAWIQSDGSFAQSNTSAQVTANASLLIPSSTISTINLNVLIHSADGTTTPNVSDVTLDFDAIIQTIDPVSQTTVFGYIKDASNQPLENVTVTATLNTDISNYKGSVISPLYKSVKTNNAGYWSLQLADNTNLTPSGSKYTFTFSGKGLSTEVNKTVPVASSTNFSDLA